MEVKVIGTTEVTVLGHIKSIEDHQKIKDTVSGLVSNGNKSIVVNIQDSMSITSSVIGFFLKLINVDQVKITLLVKDARLFNTLSAMKLIAVLNVQHI